MQLFKRFPKLVWRGVESFPPGPQKDAEKDYYPALKDDFETLKTKWLPLFYRFDQQALKAQNQFRRNQLIIISGGALAAILGALQATLGHVAWPGIVEAVLAGVLTTVAAIESGLHYQKKYFHYRAKAEVLRGEYFRFLGRLYPYDGEETRLQCLEDRMQEIESEGDV